MYSKKPNPYSFGRAAWFYDPLAALVFGGAIRHSQTALLAFIPANATVLILGGGTGWLLSDLAKLYLPLRITYLEISNCMLEKAKTKFSQLPPHKLNVDFRQGSELNLKPEEMFKIIFTPFVLDLYPETVLPAMLNKLLQHLKSNGMWLVSDFFVNPQLNSWQQYWQQKLAKGMYLFFSRLTNLPTRTLPDLEVQLQNLPLLKINVKYFYFGFIQAHAYQHKVL